MQDAEKEFFDACQKYIDADNNQFKGSLLYKAYTDVKYGEELLASYIVKKEKFDSIYAFVLTKTRIIEISVYSTMFIVSSKRYKNIKKIMVEKDFDDKTIQGLLEDKGTLDRVQIKFLVVDDTNSTEEISWENIDSQEDISQALNFAEKLSQIQVQE